MVNWNLVINHKEGGRLIYEDASLWYIALDWKPSLEDAEKNIELTRVGECHRLPLNKDNFDSYDWDEVDIINSKHHVLMEAVEKYKNGQLSIDAAERYISNSISVINAHY